MTEAAVLVGASADLFARDRLDGGEEVRPLPFLLVEITQYFIPGVGLDRAAEDGPDLAFKGLLLLAAAACALACFLLARRHSFPRVRCAAGRCAACCSGRRACC